MGLSAKAGKLEGPAEVNDETDHGNGAYRMSSEANTTQNSLAQSTSLGNTLLQGYRITDYAFP